MQEMTTAELDQVSGGGTKIGSTGGGDGGQQVVAETDSPERKATPILF